MTTPTVVPVRLKLRGDTASNWASINPTLLANELGRETDTDRIKIGDGATPWLSLPYQSFNTLSAEYATSIGYNYVLTPGFSGMSLGDITVEAGKTIEVPDGHSWTVFSDTPLSITQFRDARKIYVAKTGSNSNNGTSLGEPLLTLGAAAAAAEPGDIVFVAPGTYTEASLPIRWKRDVSVMGAGLRNTVVQPASGQEYNDIFKVDSGFYCWGMSFAGHQADSDNDLQAWAVSFDEQADNTSLGASGIGAYILKSPYIQNCTSITAEDDAGNAGSRSTGDTGGGIKVDGSKCATNSPIRSMVVDSYTQVNLGGPGCLVQNDGYAQLVSFFGTFCTYHVRTETGGQVNLSGGGTTDFGTYGLMADGYSPTPLFTGAARVATYGASRIEKTVTINVGTAVFTAASHGLSADDQVTFKATDGALPTGITTGTTYYVISSGLTTDEFKVSATSGGASITLSGSADGTYNVIRQGELSVDVVSFSANRLGSTNSRPNAGQLMFPQLVFPRNSSTQAPEAKTFAYTRTGNFTLTFTEAAAASGPDHEYVSGGTATISGTDYGVADAVYNKTTGVVTLTTVTQLPAGDGNVTVEGLSFICPTSAYIVTSSAPINASGVVVENDDPTRAGYRVNFFNAVNGGLINSLTADQVLDFRNRSQISAPSHTFEFVGSGTNYDALPWNGGVPVQANAIIETNNGKVYSSNTNEKGDFAVGSQFSVDGTTGAVTITTDQFNLSGLNFIGPFSRNGGFSTVGVQLQEVSNDTNLIASTGAADGNTVPTQFAVKAYAAPLASPAFTGTPTAPTAPADTNTTQLASTAFVLNQAATTTPLNDGTAAAGTSLRYARADHVHPTDATLAPLASPALTGTPTAPTAVASTNNTQLATTAFVQTTVQAAQQGLSIKSACRVATTTNITLSGTQTIDGVAVIAGDRVLVKDQSTGSQNGIYVVDASTWTRATDFDEDADVSAGAFTFIEAGTIGADSGWVLTTPAPITLGTTALTFTQFSGAGQVIAGDGLTKTGNQLDVVTANSGRIVVASDSIDLATTGVSAGSYANVTVDTYGRVTAGTSSGPVFRVNISSAISGVALNTPTQLVFNTSTSNVESGFNLTNGRFAPATAGYYQISFTFQVIGPSSVFYGCASIKKNGTTTVAETCAVSSLGSRSYPVVQDIVYLNGSSDYLEFFAKMTGQGTGFTILADAVSTYAAGFLARPG